MLAVLNLGVSSFQMVAILAEPIKISLLTLVAFNWIFFNLGANCIEYPSMYFHTNHVNFVFTFVFHATLFQVLNRYELTHNNMPVLYQ